MRGWFALGAVLILVATSVYTSFGELITSQSHGLVDSVLPWVLHEPDHTRQPTHASLPLTLYESTPIVHPLQTDSRFIDWLSARVPSDRVPFITIGDHQYVHALRNFRYRLDQWGYGQDLVVLCLDQLCTDARDFHGYPGYLGESVAFVKVRY